MRNPDRLDSLYETLLNYHKKLPDWRFMQLFLNFLNWHYTKYGSDGFYIEDKEIVSRFNNFIKEMTE